MTDRDSKAVENAYNKYGTVVYYTALRITKSKENAEDVMHTVFSELIEKYESGATVSDSIGGWLVQLAKFRSINLINRQKLCAPETVSESPAPPTDAIAENKLMLENALAVLTDEERELFDLKVLGGFRHKEIAKILSVKPATVRWRYSEIVKKLQPMVKDL